MADHNLIIAYLLLPLQNLQEFARMGPIQVIYSRSLLMHLNYCYLQLALEGGSGQNDQWGGTWVGSHWKSFLAAPPASCPLADRPCYTADDRRERQTRPPTGCRKAQRRRAEFWSSPCADAYSTPFSREARSQACWWTCWAGSRWANAMPR